MPRITKTINPIQEDTIIEHINKVSGGIRGKILAIQSKKTQIKFKFLPKEITSVVDNE